MSSQAEAREIRLTDFTADFFESHADAIISVAGDISTEIWQKENFRIELPEKWQLSAVAVVEHGPVGYAVVSRKDPSTAHLHHLMVAAAWRGSGLGSRLMSDIETRARSTGCTRLTIKVEVLNDGALRFYERMGYRTEKNLGDYLLLEKTIRLPDDENRMRVLCLDNEGGHGGSSRSLFHIIRHMDRSDVDVEVWCCRSGPVEEWYRSINVVCKSVPNLPRFKPPRPGIRHLIYQVRMAVVPYLAAFGHIAKWINDIDGRFDVVHFNHTSFALLSRWFRIHTKKPFVMHVRTRPDRTFVTRYLAKRMRKAINRFVFITENERSEFEFHVGPVTGRVVYNVPALPTNPAPSDRIAKDGRFKVLSLSHFVWVRGLDRVAEVAGELVSLGRRDIVFVMAGDMHMPRGIPDPLHTLAVQNKTFVDYVRQCGLDDMFQFLGPVSDPERMVLASDVTIKLSRENNPWGRDIIESMALGNPVIAIGDWDGFIVNGETGLLFPEYDCKEIARSIIDLADNPDRCRVLGERAREHIETKCNVVDRAAELKAEWQLAAKPTAQNSSL